MVKSQAYSIDNIAQLKAMEAIRQASGMYMGDTGPHGRAHLAAEILDNAMDEIIQYLLACRARKETPQRRRLSIDVTVGKRGSLTVEDYGRGMPFDWHKETAKPGLVLVFTELHAGGKFRGKGEGAYTGAGGLHGVGNKVVNAFSERLKVTVWRNGLRAEQKFIKGGVPDGGTVLSDATGIIGEVSADLELVLNSEGLCTAIKVGGKAKPVKPFADERTGTRVEFMPDQKLFEMEEGETWPRDTWHFDMLSTRFRQMVCLRPGVTVRFVDERSGNKEEFKAEKGLLDYLAWMAEGLTPLPGAKPITFTAEDLGVLADQYQNSDNPPRLDAEVALTWAGDSDPQFAAFTNSIPQPDGGTHVVALKEAISRALGEMVKEKDFRGEDAMIGLQAVISVTFKGEKGKGDAYKPNFKTQTKMELASPEARSPLVAALKPQLVAFFTKNTGLRTAIVQLARTQAEQRAMWAAAREATKAGVMSGGEGSVFIPAKLADARRMTGFGSDTVAPRELTSLYLVEGDSAAGTVKAARDALLHALLSLRGKIQNTARGKASDHFGNAEIRAISAAIGCAPGKDFNLEDFRYGRLVLLTDADPDGGHIRALILTFLMRYYPGLIAAERVTIARPPLFQVAQTRKGGQVRYVYSIPERDAAIRALGGHIEELASLATEDDTEAAGPAANTRNITVQRYKGLGEMSAGQMAETALALPPGLKELTRKPAELKAAFEAGKFSREAMVRSAHETVVTLHHVEEAQESITLLMTGARQEDKVTLIRELVDWTKIEE
jgi:DNA gyrase subunit B